MRVRETAAVRDVVLSEIAWAGTSAPTFAAWPGFAPETSSDEWIELRNTTARTIDLTGWTLTAADGTPNIALRGRIPPHGSYLLERTADGSAPAATADQIYTGALGKHRRGPDPERRRDGHRPGGRLVCRRHGLSHHAARGRHPAGH